MDLISVIVPIYNVEPYLNRCIESIVNQTYKNLEIILVDDGSPDNCPAMCDRWAKRDSRIKVIHKQNGGLSDARNAGLASATGNLISFIDSDDWIEPDFFSSLFNAMEAVGAEAAECSTAYTAEDGKVLQVRSAASPSTLGRIDALRRLVLEDGVYQTVWNKLYQRRIIEGIPFAVGKCNEDDFWTYQVLDRIQNLATVETPLYHYLQRDTSIIGVGYNIRRLDGLEARFRRMQYLQKYEELATLTRQQLVLECMWHLQCALHWLSGEEQCTACKTIYSLLYKTQKVSLQESTLTLKGKFRYALFMKFPIITAELRNLFGIGM